jgi:hypothetical protein
VNKKISPSQEKAKVNVELYDTVITETKKCVNIYRKDGKASDMNASKSDRHCNSSAFLNPRGID